MQRGPLRLDPSRRAVTCDGRPVPLTATEFMILATLMYNPLQVFSRAMLREKISTFDESERDSVKTHITNLRRKLRSAGGIDDPIENVYGIGYRLADLGQ